MTRKQPRWTALNEDFDLEMLGLIPGFFDLNDPRPAREQIAQNYWPGYHPTGKGKWKFDPEKHTLQYPDDSLYEPLASTVLRDERIFFYEHAFVAIVQKDNTFDVIRMD